jgi:vitamin B12 transporter
VFARVENLLDREYEEVIGFGTPGMSAFLGIRFSL